MQTTDLHQIKAALFDQAFTGKGAGDMPDWGSSRYSTAQGPNLGDDQRMGMTLVQRGQCMHWVVGRGAATPQLVLISLAKSATMQGRKRQAVRMITRESS